jgi:uncharacterized membrane protein
MSDMNQSNGNQVKAAAGMMEPGPGNAQLIYILYLVGFIVGITTIVGLVLAYINKGKTGGFVESHYIWLIRTFWIGLLYTLIGFILTFVLIGLLVLVATFIWMIIRLVTGLQKLNRGEPIANPQSWMF